MFRFIWMLSIRTRDFLHRYMPSNRLLAAIRTRRGLKWGVPAMLVAAPYVLVATICSDLVADGGPGWLHLAVLWGCWNTLKFIVIGPISVVLLVCVRIREAMLRRDQRREARADEREPLVLAYSPPREHRGSGGSGHLAASPTASADRDPMLDRCAADRVRTRADIQADLYQRQPAVVEVGCFMNTGRIDSTTTDRNLTPRQMLRHRPTVYTEQRGQLNERRTVAYLATSSSTCSTRRRV